jgi:uncharacterized protein with PIN domain
VIESLGIPHVEVDVILVNGEPAIFSYGIHDGDRIEIFPDGSGMNVPASFRLGPSFGPEERFICDDHLWKLARRLRLLGLDVVFQKESGDKFIIQKARDEDRVILTRDRHLLMFRQITRAILIRSNHCDEQVKEVLKRLTGIRLNPFSKCMACNGCLINLDPCSDAFNEVKGNIPSKVLSWCQAYQLCDSCKKVYWRGSHHQRLVSLINEKYLGYIADTGESGIMEDDQS